MFLSFGYEADHVYLLLDINSSIQLNNFINNQKNGLVIQNEKKA